MIEHVYSICKSSWWINIKIIAEIKNCPNTYCKDGLVKVAEGIWLKYANKPLVEDEIFCDEYLPYFSKGLKIVETEIKKNSSYDENLIIINSVQFNPLTFIIIKRGAKTKKQCPSSFCSSNKRVIRNN